MAELSIVHWIGVLDADDLEMLARCGQAAPSLYAETCGRCSVDWFIIKPPREGPMVRLCEHHKAMRDRAMPGWQLLASRCVELPAKGGDDANTDLHDLSPTPLAAD